MKDKHLSYLLENAFDFLDRAIDQFKTEPKYSVINFCCAIELLLKSRLLNEHWSLILLDRKEIINKHNLLDRFEKGDFKSLNFKDLIPTINNVCKEKISPKVKDCFHNIADNRNLMIHFYHIESQEAKEETLKKIAMKQALAWMYLSEIFQNPEWSFLTPKYNEKIRTLKRKMFQHYEFLFAIKTDEIEKAKKEGKTFIQCQCCQFDSYEESEEEYIYKSNQTKYKHYNCWVCKNNDIKLLYHCKNCKKAFYVHKNDLNEDYYTCSNCNYLNLINFNPVSKDNYFEDFHSFEVSCLECGSVDKTMQLDEENYICKECLCISDELNQCGWCNEIYLGEIDLEDSYNCGCDSCDGHLGWHIYD